MRISSKIKKTISKGALLALSSGSLLAAPINTSDDALDQLTGQNQPTRGQWHTSCVSVTPYFLSNFGSSSFHSLTLDGINQFGHETPGKCMEPNQNGKCDRGFVKVWSTVRLACHVPIAL